jgi:trimeric autotransporter adhesin
VQKVSAWQKQRRTYFCVNCIFDQRIYDHYSGDKSVMFKSRAVILLLFVCATSRAQLIATLAGGGSNDGRPAAQTALAAPLSIAFDSSGNLYIAEFLLNRIRKVDAATRIITTVAGSGARGFAGDGGPAIAAALAGPAGIAIDSVGNLYILDAANNRIRKVTAATQIITTVAGGGPLGSQGEGGPATSADLSPSDVAVDAAGNLYIAEGYPSRVRRVDGVSHIITTVAGTVRGFSGDGGPATDSKLDGAIAVEVDVAGNLYIVDISNQRIRRVDAVTKIITTIAGTGGTGGFGGDGGPATAASLNYPSDVVIDRSGNLYIADGGNARIRRVDAATKIIATVAGTGIGGFSGDGGPAVAAQLSYSTGLGVDASDNLYVVDAGRVRKVDRFTNVITTEAGGLGDSAPATAAVLIRPRNVALDSAGNLYIADKFNNRIRKVNMATKVITTVAGTGVGGFSGDGGPATSAKIYTPFGVALDAAGNLYIADDDNYRIRRVDAATGIITTVAGGGEDSGDGGPATAASLGETSNVAVDAAGNIYIGVWNRIRRVDAATGIITTVAGGGSSASIGDGGPATAAQLLYPGGVSVDAAGNLYIADTGNGRIRKVDAVTKIITTIAGGGSTSSIGDGGPANAASLASPNTVALDAAGNLYIADSRNNRIRKVSAATKIISTVAGTGTEGFSGDGGAAISATLNYPGGVSVDVAGIIYIADTENDRVRVVGVQAGRRRAVHQH